MIQPRKTRGQCRVRSPCRFLATLLIGFSLSLAPSFAMADSPAKQSANETAKAAEIEKPAGETSATPSPSEKSNSEQAAQFAEMHAHEHQSNKLSADHKFAEAAREADAALAIARKADRDTPDFLSQWISFAADARADDDDFSVARQLYAESHSILQKNFPADDWRITNARLSLARVDRLSGLSADARRQLKDAADWENKCSECINQRHYDDALAAAKRSFDLRRAIVGDQDPVNAATALDIGALYSKLGKIDDSRAWKQRSSDLLSQSLGEMHPKYAICLLYLGNDDFSSGDYARALPYYRRARDILRSTVGTNDSRTQTALGNVADGLQRLGAKNAAAGDFAAAQKQFQELVAVTAERFGESDWRTTNVKLEAAFAESDAKLSVEQRGQFNHANELETEAAKLVKAKDYANAVKAEQAAFEIRDKLFGEGALTAASALRVGHDYLRLRDGKQALVWNQKSVDIGKRVFGERHPRLASSLNNLADSYVLLGDLGHAEPLLRQAFEIRKQTLGESDPNTITTANDFARLLERIQRKGLGASGVDAKQLAKDQALLTKQSTAPDWRSVDAAVAAAREKRMGLLSVEALAKLAQADQSQKQYSADNSDHKYLQAAENAKKAFELRQEVLGDKDPLTADSAYCAGSAYNSAESYREAARWLERAIELQRQIFGVKHPKCAASLEKLGISFAGMSEYAKAAIAFKEAIAVHDDANDGYVRDIARCLRRLASADLSLGRYSEVEPLMRRAMSIDKSPSGDEMDYGSDLNALAYFYRCTSDYARAEDVYKQAIEIHRRQVSKRPILLAEDDDALAGVYIDAHDYNNAETYARQAMELYKKALGETSNKYLISMDRLASALTDTGHHSEAEPLYLREITIRENLLHDEGWHYAAALQNLGLLYKQTGDYERAEPLITKGLNAAQRIFGKNHPTCAVMLGSLAAVEDLLGKYAKAEDHAKQALEIDQNGLELAGNFQSERQQLLMTRIDRSALDLYLSIAIRGKVPAEQVYGLVLDWKGSVSARQQAMRQVRAMIESSHSAELLGLFDRLSDASRELSNVSAEAAGNDDAHQKRLIELNDRVEQLQEQLAIKSEAFRKQLESSHRTPDDIRRVLPADTALVDLFEYRYRGIPKTKTGTHIFQFRYAAFVVRPGKPIVRIELGSATPIHAAVESWRKDFGAASAGKVTDPAQTLRRLVWDKLEPSLEGAKTVLLSPDGVTAQFPWAALPGKRAGTYLIEDTSVAIVPIPRLLPELLAEPRPSSETDGSAVAAHGASLLLVGDVNFDADPGGAASNALAQAAPRGTRSGELFHWPALPGTRTEIVTIADSFEQQFPDAKIKKLRDANATKDEVVSQIDRFRYVHFATHGFFATNQFQMAISTPSRGQSPGAKSPYSQQDLSKLNPGLLSGLVLAGANRPPQDGKDDGILTALEVGSLDLRNVDLATLSACETGLGQTAGGEGILGLQRAFQISGAKSVMATLWKIHDDASRSLMIDFYENLWRKKMSKVEALRQAQLTMLREGIKRGLELPDDQPPDKAHRLPPYYWAPFVLSGDWR